MHYLDFENLHKQQQALKQRTPEELIDKLILRTDKWILSNYKQSGEMIIWNTYI